mmetsp:Transcript_1596/g.5498  ORF Transcript_1596/g.5498 Transcript_1596/m.5498 type:complete len:107 (+) Transcript_1596:1633-1953(+)
MLHLGMVHDGSFWMNDFGDSVVGWFFMEPPLCQQQCENEQISKIQLIIPEKEFRLRCAWNRMDPSIETRARPVYSALNLDSFRGEPYSHRINLLTDVFSSFLGVVC